MNLINLNSKFVQHRQLKTVTLEVVNHCNLNCKYCYLDDNITNMPLNDVYRILDDSRNLGALELRISGGEPLIRKDLEKIIVYARKLYMDVVILSNLTMLDDSILNIIDRFGLTKVETSIFSLNPEINDSFMGKQGTLKKQINNIKELQKHKVLIKVKTFAYRFNFDELKDMIYFLISHLQMGDTKCHDHRLF